MKKDPNQLEILEQWAMLDDHKKLITLHKIHEATRLFAA